MHFVDLLSTKQGGKLMLPPTIQNSASNISKSLNIAGINLLALDAVEVH